MLKILITKEVREILGSLKFVITFGACSALIILSFYMGAKNYALGLAQYEAARAQNLKQLDGLTDWFSVDKQRIFLPPQPLATLVNGISNDMGRTIEVQGRGELMSQDSRYNDDPIFAIFRFLDLDFIFGTILSLFAILLGYNSISGEKEQGTLSLTMSNPVSRSTYILSKLIGSAISLILPLLAALAIGCLMLLAFRFPLSGEDWVRLTGIIGTGLLYATLFLCLSIFVSSLTHKSSGSFLLVLTIWIFGALIVPRASVLLAARAVDVPSVDEVTAQKSRYASQLFKEEKTSISKFKPSQTDDFMKMEEEFNRYMGEIADERDKKLGEFAGRLNEDRSNRVRERQRLSLSLARVSPTTSLTLALASLAGTSIPLDNHFHDEARRYQEAFGNFMVAKTGMKPGGRMLRIKMSLEDEEEPEPINPNELPVFDFRPIPLDVSFKSALLDIGLLFLYGFVFFAGSIWTFGRYDLR